jgi:hypothetical protein
MELNEIKDIIKMTIAELKAEGLLGNASANDKVIGKTEKAERNTYQKTEQLLYNYNNFKKIIDERMEDIEHLRIYGVPRKSGSVVEYHQSNGTVGQLTLEEEDIDCAIRTVQASVQGTMQAVALIDKCMEAISHDPWYRILPMRYFEGRTQEDIAVELNTTQKTISVNKNRLVKELALRLFPSQVVDEIMN